MSKKDNKNKKNNPPNDDSSTDEEEPYDSREYNKFLSKRRINSVKNYVGIYKNGIL